MLLGSASSGLFYTPLDFGFLDGSPSDYNDVIWDKISNLLDRKYLDLLGNEWAIDKFAIDSGWATNQVYNWVHKDQIRRMAVKGDAGWHKVAIPKMPSPQEITMAGKKIKRGVKLWHIGTYGLKSQFYADLRKEGVRDDQIYLKQITSEYIVENKNKRTGKPELTWKKSGQNHLLDCRIYNMAVADHLGLRHCCPIYSEGS